MTNNNNNNNNNLIYTVPYSRNMLHMELIVLSIYLFHNIFSYCLFSQSFCTQYDQPLARYCRLSVPLQCCVQWLENTS